MKTINCLPLVLVILFSVLLGCSSAKSTTLVNPSAASVAGTEDGSSEANAVKVKSVDAEYSWIKTNYPQSRVTSQALVKGTIEKKKYYDVLTVSTQGGEKKFWFDISSFFGK